MLTDKQKRAIFDQFGEEGLRGGGGGARAAAGGAPAGGPGVNVRFASSGGGGGFNDPRVIFSQFFGTSNPFAAFGGGGM